MLDTTTPSKLRFRLLGEARLAVGDAPWEACRVSTQKGTALLIYLAMNEGRPIPRGRLASLLWGDRVDDQARGNLRQCLLTLRRDLGPAARVLIADDNSLALPADSIEVDALQFVAWANAPDPAANERCLEIG